MDPSQLLQSDALRGQMLPPSSCAKCSRQVSRVWSEPPIHDRRPEEGRKPGVKGIGHPEPNGTLPKTLIPQKIAPAPATKGRLQRRPAGIVHAPEPPMRVFGTVRAKKRPEAKTSRRGKTNARPGSDGRGRQAPQMACSTNLVPHHRPRRSKDIEKVEGASPRSLGAQRPKG